jgi:CHASE3 domain sensor protein
MPISQALFRRSNALLLAIGIAVLVAIVATSLWLTSASECYFGEVTAARAVRSAAADLLSLVQDAETGQRGFLLTRDATYPEPYKVAVSRLTDQLAQLERAAAKLREVGPLFQRVTSELDQKMAELAATVEATRRDDTETAMRLVELPRFCGHP